MLDAIAMSPESTANTDPVTRAGVDDGSPNTSSDPLGAQMTSTREDDNASMSAQSHSSVRAHYPADEGQTHEEGRDDTLGRPWNGSEKGHQQRASQQQGPDYDDQHSQEQHRRQADRQRGSEDGPACLLDVRDRVEACSHRVQAWADDQELKSRQRQERARDQRDGGVRIDADGRVIEPKGDSIAQRKGIIPLVAVILSWVYVAYVWRVCVRGIQQKESATATRSEAIGLLVGFHILWLMAIWAYIKVILTKPGFVRDHFPISDPPSNATPPSRDQLAYVYQLYYEKLGEKAGDVANTTAENPQETPATPPSVPLTAPIIQSDMNASDSVDSKLAAVLGPAGVGLVAKANEVTNLAAEGQADRANQANVQEVHAPPQHDPQPSATIPPPEIPQQPVHQLSDIPEPLRLPQTLMPLHPNNTYCYRCKRVKPPRAHHCRHCGTCVLKMDHHCPWVGGCVGAGNQKFFYHFLQWVTALELFVLVTNAVMLNRGIRRSGTDIGWPIDGYMISLVPLSAIFFLFTFALLITHSYLLVMNLTTIEHMAYDRQNTREDILIEQWQRERHRRLGERKPTFFQQSRQRNQTKGRWATFWGKPKTEANPWWLDGKRATRLMSKDGALDGDARHTPRLNPGETEASVEQTLHWYHGILPNWRQGMGNSVFGWILPVGKALNPDGLVYEGNWRFGPYGEWTPRQHWSSRLQPVSDSTAVAP